MLFIRFLRMLFIHMLLYNFMLFISLRLSFRAIEYNQLCICLCVTWFSLTTIRHIMYRDRECIMFFCSLYIFISSAIFFFSLANDIFLLSFILYIYFVWQHLRTLYQYNAYTQIAICGLTWSEEVCVFRFIIKWRNMCLSVRLTCSLYSNT